MATYTIVADDTDPLGPNEIRAGDDIVVNDGDVFIIDPSADKDVDFKSPDGAPVNFEVRFEESNLNKVDYKFDNGLNPTINISDNVDLSNTFINADKADSIVLVAGDGVTLDHYHGSKGVDTFTAGDDFTMFDHLRTGDGDDVIRIGKNAQLDEIDGGKDNDTLYTETEPSTFKSSNIESSEVVCFAAGTLIATGAGPVAVEDLRVGDMVTTMDNGEQPLRWIGSCRLGPAQLMLRPKLRPIRIAAGALGRGTPERDLVVSPQHRVMIRSTIAQRMFAESEILVAAVKLVGMPGIEVIETAREVTYFHLLLERHEILFSEGAATESLYPGPQALSGMAPAAVEEITCLFPELSEQCGKPTPARLLAEKGRQIRTLLQRHLKNRKALIAEFA
ncbi:MULTISPECIES: Hint domain-containing protein [unclassified Marinovum]